MICNDCMLSLPFTLRLRKNVCCEAPPPLCAGEEVNVFWFIHRHRRRVCIGFAKRHPPPFARLAGRMKSVSSSALVLTMHALPAALLVRTFTVFFGSFAGEAAPCLRLSRDRTFRLRLLHVRTLLGDLWLFSRRGSRLAFGFRATGLSTLRFHATGFC